MNKKFDWTSIRLKQIYFYGILNPTASTKSSHWEMTYNENMRYQIYTTRHNNKVYIVIFVHLKVIRLSQNQADSYPVNQFC